MDGEERKRTLTIILVATVVLVIIAAVLYLLFGLAIVAQSISFGITSVILLIIVLVLLIISLYLWIKLLWLRRDFNKCEEQNSILKKKIKKYKTQLKQKKEIETKNSKITKIKNIFK